MTAPMPPEIAALLAFLAVMVAGIFLATAMGSRIHWDN
jgi:hypothetical protein